MTGGSSSASRPRGTVRWWSSANSHRGSQFPWADVTWMPGEQPKQPVGLSGREAIRFRTRGDGRPYSEMLIASSEPVGPPAYRDVRRARGVDPGGDPAGGFSDSQP